MRRLGNAIVLGKRPGPAGLRSAHIYCGITSASMLLHGCRGNHLSNVTSTQKAVRTRRRRASHHPTRNEARVEAD